MNKINLDKLLNVLGGVEISEKEMKSLEWLSQWEEITIENICNVIKKSQKTT